MRCRDSAGMGPVGTWHLIDTIYATSASLARAAETSPHAIATRKAAFLACVHAVLIRSCFTMLTTHTSSHPAPPAAQPPAAHLPDPQPDPSPATSRAASPTHADSA